MDGVCTYLKGVVSGWCMHLFEGCGEWMVYALI